jgi:hypothetical protein
MGNDGYLETYLRDHLATGKAWRGLAERAARRDRGTPLGRDLDAVRRAIADDVDTLEGMMASLGFGPSRLKDGVAIAMERAGRLKLNRHLVRPSPLSRLEELDALIAGIEGKLDLWATLRDRAGLAHRFPSVDFDVLIERARAQRASLELHRRRAAREALSPVTVIRVPIEAGEGPTQQETDHDALVEEASRDSFPASDPPSYWARDVRRGE